MSAQGIFITRHLMEEILGTTKPSSWGLGANCLHFPEKKQHVKIPYEGAVEPIPVSPALHSCSLKWARSGHCLSPRESHRQHRSWAWARSLQVSRCWEKFGDISGREMSSCVLPAGCAPGMRRAWPPAGSASRCGLVPPPLQGDGRGLSASPGLGGSIPHFGFLWMYKSAKETTIELLPLRVRTQ